MPEANQIKQKMQSFDGILFTMTFSAKKLQKTILLGEGKNLKA